MRRASPRSARRWRAPACRPRAASRSSRLRRAARRAPQPVLRADRRRSCSGRTQMRARDRALARARRRRRSAAGSTPSARSRRSRRSPATRTSTRTRPFPSSSPGGPRFEATALGASADRRAARACATTSRSATSPRVLWSSAARTCRARARCCARVGRHAVLALAGAPVRARAPRPLAAPGRRLAARPGLAAGGHLALLRRDHSGSRQIVELAGAGRRRCSSCSTRSSTARTRTTAGSAPRRSCAGSSARGAIGLVTTHDLALARDRRRARPARPQRPLRGPARRTAR